MTAKLHNTPAASAHASTDAIATAERVLRTEATALIELAGTLDQRFVQAIDLMAAAEGRVIVTGMGKSGHIARKIAATMASTGTPAFFVHPAETSHGDMGMIVRGDVVIALSNSGESRELNDLIEYTRRYAIPLIGVTSKAASTLGTKCDVQLLLPQSPEACPNGLAPTTSTTLSLALGDALAVALLERKGFTATDFRVYHPGGKLGQQLMRVDEIMHSGDKLPVAPMTVSIAEAVKISSAKTFGCVALTNDDGTLAGIITDGDIRRALTNTPDLLAQHSTTPAAAIMTKNPRVADITMLVAEAMAVMNGLSAADGQTKRQITVLIVVDGANKPVGLLHLHDCLRAGFA